MHIPGKPDSTLLKEDECLLERTLDFSRYVKQLLHRQPELKDSLLKNLHTPFTVQQMRALLNPVRNEAELFRALRELRGQVMLRLILRDLSALADLGEVTRTTTSLAEETLNFALTHLNAWMQQDYGIPVGSDSREPQELLVIGMGKLGGGELNVSSDIDLVFVYPEEGVTSGPRSISNHEYFDRLCRKLIAAISVMTENGFVFRVDTRLRPYGESGPLAVSLAMLESYFITQGREWERYAWIKARVVCGSRGEELMQLARPFVFRKYLDYAAFNSMRGLHEQVRQEVRRRDMTENIKLGPGGIREIEFIAQVFQLIRGGRDSELRIRPTLAVLEKLVGLNLLPAQAGTELRDAYVFLRNLEHRLQYLDDDQTQSLPRNEQDRALISKAMGFDSFEAFLQQLGTHRARVSLHFEQVFAAPQITSHPLLALWEGTFTDEEAVKQLTGLGYLDPQQIVLRLRNIRHSSRYRQMPATNQSRLDALMPAMIEAAAPFGDAALERLLLLAESIGRRESYLALLVEYPQVLQSLAKLCAASSWTAQYLAQHPVVLDELLDARTLYSPPDWPRLHAALSAQLLEADTEQQMDILRQFHNAQVFRLVAQDLAGLLALETLSDHLSDLADLILKWVLRLCWEGLRQKHRAEPYFAIIGYGKLGGKELGYASDLDLIFLYDDEHPEAQAVYARLAQRINSWLTSYTAAGILYDTDLRLRPDGAGGLLVSEINAFSEYQRLHAWVWEHQALTRGRFVAGNQQVGNRFEAIRKEVLCAKRDLGKLRSEILNMRGKMLEAHPNESGLFDLKHDRGGIIDVEFIVQYVVLGHAHARPVLTGNIGNLALLNLAAELKLLPADLAEQVRIGYREFRRLQHGLRLNNEKYTRVEASAVKKQREAVVALWDWVFNRE
ncbi:MAG TPA: bifunctional [glutamate--ammonia ligase]-adenylyl-L-tyrosine phosphorylase/[glutamate--ammonia-ligase] adenylyltransferase [Burkholderiales bacterium]|nr:bifunctional [glutamate--ammonia ligase]-adenylyl-L-tyrosine phosphorylase/[glutamate--ammonia-ligase] adenylyltransferase [Burkholderiales bacterium]